MSLPERRTGRIDRDLAVQSFWQLGPQTLRKRVQRRDLFGTLAQADGAPLAEPELALSWIIDEWHQQGSLAEGRVRFTWYALARDLYGSGRPGWSPSGRHRELLREAIDHLHQVVVTLRSINVHDGDTERTLRSKVHILETVVDHDDVTRYRDDVELARMDDEPADTADAPRSHAAALGRLRRDSVEVSIAPWLVHQLLTGAVVLDWRTQRKLSGAAKRLWYQLCAMEREFEPTGLPGEARIAILLDADFYAAMHLGATRERDNRAALAAAAQRLVAADDTFRSAKVARRYDGTYELRAVRVMPTAVRDDEDGQLLLTGYARVSTADQNPDHQIDALRRAGVTDDDIYVDHASGAKASRPQLDIVLRLLRNGDTLKITRLDRLGRSVLHLVTLGAELRDRGGRGPCRPRRWSADGSWRSGRGSALSARGSSRRRGH